jgi:hypothetical protein
VCVCVRERERENKVCISEQEERTLKNERRSLLKAASEETRDLFLRAFFRHVATLSALYTYEIFLTVISAELDLRDFSNAAISVEYFDLDFIQNHQILIKAINENRLL